MTPPKRKTGGGRVTPKGTKPGQVAATPSSLAHNAHTRAGEVAASSRYTPPVPLSVKESPTWVPVLMVALLIIGALTIIARYLLNDSVGNWLVFVGLGFVLAGLFTATKWH
ncbi:MAG TPA: cell division protein CrgA [Ilumatobacteraceae bacterium]|nr:cell division protein CrgA [Ilumatobacteraceae bacterium]